MSETKKTPTSSLFNFTNCSHTSSPRGHLVFLDCCGRAACWECIIQSNEPCGMCGKEVRVDRCTALFEGDSSVCPYVGCERVILSSRLDTHKELCHYRPVECSFGGPRCEDVRFGELEDHEKGCNFAPVFCLNDGCGATIARCDLLDHQLECPFAVLKCADCGNSVKRSEMLQHADVCDKRIVVCDYDHIGCLVALPRCEMESHKKNDAAEHVDLLLSAYTRQQQLLLQHQQQLENHQQQLEQEHQKQQEQQQLPPPPPPPPLPRSGRGFRSVAFRRRRRICIAIYLTSHLLVAVFIALRLLRFPGFCPFAAGAVLVAIAARGLCRRCGAPVANRWEIASRSCPLIARYEVTGSLPCVDGVEYYVPPAKNRRTVVHREVSAHPANWCRKCFRIVFVASSLIAIVGVIHTIAAGPLTRRSPILSYGLICIVMRMVLDTAFPRTTVRNNNSTINNNDNKDEAKANKQAKKINKEHQKARKRMMKKRKTNPMQRLSEASSSPQLASPAPPSYLCAACKTHISSEDLIVSRNVVARHGSAALFSHCENVTTRKMQKRVMITGEYSVADVACKGCNTVLGWIYCGATGPRNQYKIGKYVLEMTLLEKA